MPRAQPQKQPPAKHTAGKLPRPREPREPREEHRGRDEQRPREAPRDLRNEPTVWFTINVGRYKNADPKWLVPLLCRRGNITKRAIGKIQILARETRVAIAADAAEQFAQAVRRPDPKDPQIHIEPAGAL